MYTPPNLKRTYGEPYTPEQIEYIYDAAANGLPMRTIAKKLNSTYSSVRSVVHRQGLGVKHIREIYTLTRKQLSDALDIPWQGLLFLLAHHGIKPHKDTKVRWLNLKETTAFLQDQRYWWRWQPQRITLDWLRDLATEIRSQPVTGVWLPATDAAAQLGIGYHAVQWRINNGTVTAQRLGTLWLVWCPTEK